MGLAMKSRAVHVTKHIVLYKLFNTAALTLCLTTADTRTTTFEDSTNSQNLQNVFARCHEIIRSDWTTDQQINLGTSCGLSHLLCEPDKARLHPPLLLSMRECDLPRPISPIRDEPFPQSKSRTIEEPEDSGQKIGALTRLIVTRLFGLVVRNGTSLTLGYLSDPLAPVPCGKRSDCVGERQFA